MNVAAKNIDAWWSHRVDVVVAGMLNSKGSIIRIVVVGGCCSFFFFYCCCCSSAFLLPDATVVARNTQTATRITMYHDTTHEYRSQQTARTRITPPPSSSVPSSDRINTKTMMVTTTTRMMMAKSNHDKEEEKDIRDDDNNNNNNNNNKNNNNNNIEDENEGDKEENVTVADVSMMPALDIVLERARKRKSSNIGILITKVQAFVDGPLWIIPAQNNNNNNKITGSNTPSSLVTFKRIDGLLVLTALLLQANGFALGWIAGKITINPLTTVLQSLPFSSSTMMILVLPFWPVLWAITFDQLLP